MNVRHLRKALEKYDDDVKILIGYEGTSGPFIGIDEHFDGFQNPHWDPEKHPASSRYLIDPNTIVLWTH